MSNNVKKIIIATHHIGIVKESVDYIIEITNGEVSDVKRVMEYEF